jgi:hypothetical protein
LINNKLMSQGILHLRKIRMIKKIRSSSLVIGMLPKIVPSLRQATQQMLISLLVLEDFLLWRQDGNSIYS